MEIIKEFTNYSDFIKYVKENKITRMERKNENGKIILIYNK